MNINIDNLVITGRGSAALFAILKALNVKKKHILLPVNICEIVYTIIINAGFKPVFYDVSETDGNARLEMIMESYTGEETVLLAVSNYGTPVEIDLIMNWARGNNIFVIEDICNSFGAIYKNKLLGTWGDAAILSFGYVKIIEYGIGGAALIKDKDIKSDVQKIVNAFALHSNLHIEKDAFFQSMLRDIRNAMQSDERVEVYNKLYNDYFEFLLYKINERNASEVIDLIKDLDNNLSERKRKAQRYRSEINAKLIKHIPEIEGQVYWRYNLLLEPSIKGEVINVLRQNKLLVSSWYPPILELFERNVDKDRYWGSYSFSEKVINLFVDHRVTDEDITNIVKILNNY